MKKLTFEEVRELYRVGIWDCNYTITAKKLLETGYLVFKQNQIPDYRALLKTPEQKQVFEKIFGKEYPPEGTWCYVWDDESDQVDVRQWVGQGFKIPSKNMHMHWDNFQPIKDQDDIPEHLKG